MVTVTMAMDVRMIVQIRRMDRRMRGEMLVNAKLITRRNGREYALQIGRRLWRDRCVRPIRMRLMYVAHRQVVIQPQSRWVLVRVAIVCAHLWRRLTLREGEGNSCVRICTSATPGGEGWRLRRV